MTATLRHYSHGTIENADGTAAHFGSNTQPIKEVTVDGDVVSADEIIPIPAGTLVTLWAYSASDPEFALFHLALDGGVGFLDVYWQGDKPTSASDMTPMGTHVSWNQAGLSCTTNLALTQDILVASTVAVAAGDNAGFPAISYGNSGFQQGFIYKIVAKNRGTDPVRLKRTRVN